MGVRRSERDVRGPSLDGGRGCGCCWPGRCLWWCWLRCWARDRGERGLLAQLCAGRGRPQLGLAPRGPQHRQPRGCWPWYARRPWEVRGRIHGHDGPRFQWSTSQFMRGRVLPWTNSTMSRTDWTLPVVLNFHFQSMGSPARGQAVLMSLRRRVLGCSGDAVRTSGDDTSNQVLSTTVHAPAPPSCPLHTALTTITLTFAPPRVTCSPAQSTHHGRIAFATLPRSTRRERDRRICLGPACKLPPHNPPRLSDKHHHSYHSSGRHGGLTAAHYRGHASRHAWIEVALHVYNAAAFVTDAQHTTCCSSHPHPSHATADLAAAYFEAQQHHSTCRSSRRSLVFPRPGQQCLGRRASIHG